jgi:flagellin-like hook-associated protein FlgL
MSSETLEARIAAWPDQWKAACLNYSSALAHLAELQRQLARLNVDAAAIEPPAEVPQALNNDPAVIAADLNLLNLEHEVRLAALEADHVRAMADIAIREEAVENGLKLTESAVEARVKSDKDAMAAQRSYLNLKHQVDMAKIDRTHLIRRLQEEMRTQKQGVPSPDPVPTSTDNQALLSEIEQASAYVDIARAELGYQQRVGRSLRMLVALATAQETTNGH